MTMNGQHPSPVPNLIKASAGARKEAKQAASIAKAKTRANRSAAKAREEHGGITEDGQGWHATKQLIQARDDYRCRRCKRRDKPIEIAHLLVKVGMGGRPSSCVNQEWNLASLCHEHHAEQETSKAVTLEIVEALWEEFPAYQDQVPEAVLTRFHAEWRQVKEVAA